MQPPIPVDQIQSGLKDFSRHRVLVVGDLFLDEYVEGDMIDISKEGPIPVVRFRSRTTSPGAAGNLASSIRNLGAQVTIVGIVGDDENGRSVTGQLADRGVDTSGVIVNAEKPTLKYGKIRAGVENAPSREILRLDVLPDGPAEGGLEEAVLEKIRQLTQRVDGIVVLDQIGHLVTRRVLDALAELRASHGVFLQGSSRDHIANFHDFDLVVPNDPEAFGAVGAGGYDPERVDDVGRKLQREGRHRHVLLTLGPDGMACFDENPDLGEAALRVPTVARDVVDVTGAGDAVSSAAILAMLSGWNLETAAWCASYSAAIALARVGTHHVSLEELSAAIGVAP